MHILHIDSSPDPSNSYSRQLSARIVSHLQSQHQDATVTYRDLAASPPPHIDGSLRASWMTKPDQRTREHIDIVTRCEGYIDDIRSADVIVLGAPMHNLSVPSVLKAWLDHVCIANQTFRYTQDGPVGLIEKKRAILALARGGAYSTPPRASLDFQEPYLRAVFGFIGIRNVDAVAVEGVALGPDNAERALAEAREAITAL